MKINSYLSEKLVENCIEGIWVIDENENTIYVNEVLAKMLGYQARDFIGKKITDYMRPDESGALDLKLKERINGISETHELRLISKQGRSIWVSAACSPIMDENQQVLGAVGLLAEINERRKTEMILAAQKNVFEILIRGGSLQDALNALLKPIDSLIDGVDSSILILSEDGKRLYHGAHINLNSEFVEKINGCEIGPHSGACGTSAYRKELVITPDIIHDPLWIDYKEVAVKAGLTSCWSCPITSGDKKVLGTFALYSKEVRSPTPFELDVVRNISAAAALSIEHSHLYEKVKKHNDEMSFLAEARQILTHSIEYADVLNTMPNLIVDKGFADWAFICLKSEDGIFRTQTISSRKELGEILEPVQHLELDLSSDIGLSKAMKENYPYFLETTPEFLGSFLNASGKGAPNTKYMKVLYDLDMRSYMAIPLVARDQVIGGMMVCSNKKDRRYGQHDLELMVEVARSCANAIDNAALYLESKKSIQAREDFISIASHELRTPLTSLKMRIDLLSLMVERRQFPEEVLQKLEPIVSEIRPDVQKFAKLIETLLDISKLGSKKLQISVEEFNISKSIVDEIQRLKSEFIIYQTPLIFNVEENLTGTCDPVRLQQLVANLLMNALKFGERRPVEISVSANGKNLLIDVTDHGIGISEEDRKRIFKPFERAVSDQHFGGLGLGLYITKQIIEAHRGSVEINSSIGKGTTFHVKLPVLTKIALLP